MPTLADLESRLLRRLREVQYTLGVEPPAADPGVRFADAVDSMGLVEFLALLADDLGISAEAIEQAAGRRFGTVAELAAALAAAGIETTPRGVEDHLLLPSPPGAEGSGGLLLPSPLGGEELGDLFLPSPLGERGWG